MCLALHQAQFVLGVVALNGQFPSGIVSQNGSSVRLSLFFFV
jgi:hypothetical protein